MPLKPKTAPRRPRSFTAEPLARLRKGLDLHEPEGAAAVKDHESITDGGPARRTAVKQAESRARPFRLSAMAPTVPVPGRRSRISSAILGSWGIGALEMVSRRPCPIAPGRNLS
jgi:hypothetical protein